MRSPHAAYTKSLRLETFVRPDRKLNVVLVYEDFGMGVQGKEIFDLIAREVGGENAARLTVWRFDFFQSTELTRAVSRQAEEADVIIVAPRSPDQLPPNVKSWLEQWPQQRKLSNGALIALLDPTAVSDSKASDNALLLWRAASRANMDFFYRQTRPGARNEGISAGAIDLFAAPQPVYAIKQHWGLNE